MKSLFYPAWDTLEIADHPVPDVPKGHVLLKVAACGICGSELETFKNHSPRRRPPLIMGHEFCGTVVNPGSAPIPEGRRVVSHSLVTCGACSFCRSGREHLCPNRRVFGMHMPGAFAEYVSVPASSLIEWPDGLPAESACLAEPLANGVHVADMLKRHDVQTVVILGAGPIGLMCQQTVQVLLKAKTLVSDLVPERREFARKLGARAVLDPRTQDVAALVREATGGEGADAVVDAVGSALTKRQSLELVRPGGAVVWIGLHENTMPIDTYEITLPEKAVYGSYAASTDELRQAVSLLVSGAIDSTSWVQVFPLENGVEAFQRMLAGKGRDIKAVLRPE